MTLFPAHPVQKLGREPGRFPVPFLDLRNELLFRDHHERGQAEVAGELTRPFPDPRKASPEQALAGGAGHRNGVVGEVGHGD